MPLLEVTHVQQHFPIGTALSRAGRARVVRAVDDVSLTVRAGETLGIVGESGSGKSTLSRTIMRLHDATAGRIVFGGHDITRSSPRALRPVRRDLQMVFQDPYASLNPRKRVAQIIGDSFALRQGRQGTRAETAALLERVGLRPEHAGRYPHEFSGGQRQRIGIARALAVEPRLIIADEPVSALDVSVQAQIVNLLAELQEERGLAYIFVAHDLGVVRQVSDRVAVMYLGRLVETGPADRLYERPAHPYTQALLESVPVPDPRIARRRRAHLTGEPPSPIDPPAGCAFHTRCAFATDRCRADRPPLMEYPGGQLAACHHPRGRTSAELAAAVVSPLTPLAPDGGPAEPAR